MSVIDKIIATVTPPESDQQRREARQKANAVATPGDWLSQILGHHLQIEAAFTAVKSGADAAARKVALKNLALVLTGHAQAEEAVVYPALADGGEKTHAGMGYEEQAMVKIEMALLEKLDPMGQDFIDKLEHIEGAVRHHVYAEEGNWFLDLKKKLPLLDQAKLTERYAEEYERYVGEAPSAAR